MLVLLNLSPFEQFTFNRESTEIELNAITSITNLNGLLVVPHLEKITLRNCPNLKDISAVNHLKNLKYLTIENCNRISDLSPINALQNLVRLHCSGFPDLKLLKTLKGNTAIKQLDLLQDRKWFTGFLDTNTISLYIYFKAAKVTDLKPIASLQNVLNIGFYYCSALISIDSLVVYPNLKQLIFCHCNNLENIVKLSQLKNLNCIKFYDCNKLKTIDAILKIKNLKALYLEDCNEIRELNFKKDNSLQKLELHALQNLKKVNHLTFLRNLKLLILEDCNSFNHFNEISLLTNLEELGLFLNKETIHEDYSKIFPKLKKLNIWHQGGRLNKTF